MPDSKFVILEDNSGRIKAMQTQAVAHHIGLEQVFFTDAPSCINWLSQHYKEAALISLDHDLEPLPDKTTEPGTGRDVADWLSLQGPKRPVIVHSTNYEAAVGMTFQLEENGFTVERVTPYADLLWVSEVWIPTVKSLLQDQRGGEF